MNPSRRAPSHLFEERVLLPRDPFHEEDPSQMRFGFAETESFAPELGFGPGHENTQGRMASAVLADDPLPARMLNEFVYCPRLFYYEHVEGIFVHNADTARGTALHARVDAGTGALPMPSTPSKRRAARKKAKATPSSKASSGSQASPDDGEALETIHSRSVTLGSNSLGVVAKMDLIEVRLTPDTAASMEDSQFDLFQVKEVIPVDYKAGSPRQGVDSDAIELWDTDRMQLGLQMVILRDNGYDCTEGVIYYRATKQRVSLTLTDSLERWIQERIVAARATARSPCIPQPLKDSPKCVRCSLAPVCLPDETVLLTNREANRAPRRLMAARHETRALYLNTQGLRIGRREETLVVKEEKRVVEEVRVKDLSNVVLFGNIQISTQAIQLLCAKEIPIAYHSSGGWFYGLTRGHGLKNVFTRMEQFRAADDPVACLALARAMVFGKIRNHRTLLRRLHVEPPAPSLAKLRRAAEDARMTGSMASLLGIEGAAAALYFQHFAGMIKPGADPPDKIDSLLGEGTPSSGPHSSQKTNSLTFDFAGRNRRPPADPVNALLSLAYSLLAKDCTIAANAVGLDPYVGFYHQPRYGRPALALDLMEEFRPLIAESAVLTAINNRMLRPRHFLRAGPAVNLTPEGRKLFFQVYERRLNTLGTHPVFDYKASYRRVLELQARLLAKVLTGELPNYRAMITR